MTDESRTARPTWEEEAADCDGPDKAAADGAAIATGTADGMGAGTITRGVISCGLEAEHGPGRGVVAPRGQAI